MSKTTNRLSPDVRERTVRMVGEHLSRWLKLNRHGR